MSDPRPLYDPTEDPNEQKRYKAKRQVESAHKNPHVNAFASFIEGMGLPSLSDQIRELNKNHDRLQKR